MLIDLTASNFASSWGVVTITNPSKSRVCITVRGASEVPGGKSTSKTSIPSQLVPDNN